MKTPEEWREWVRQEADPVKVMNLIELIQKDALSDPFAQTTDQQELEMSAQIAVNERIRADQLHDELLKMRTKWHETRRYLRQANKGAERNNLIMQLQARTIYDYIQTQKSKNPYHYPPNQQP